jgi:hypothetical protein
MAANTGQGFMAGQAAITQGRESDNGAGPSRGNRLEAEISSVSGSGGGRAAGVDSEVARIGREKQPAEEGVGVRTADLPSWRHIFFSQTFALQFNGVNDYVEVIPMSIAKTPAELADEGLSQPQSCSVTPQPKPLQIHTPTICASLAASLVRCAHVHMHTCLSLVTLHVCVYLLCLCACGCRRACACFLHADQVRYLSIERFK